MAPGIFLSHSWQDKALARRLAADLARNGIRVWIDEAEILVGDSLIEKIRQGIDEMDYVAALISKASVCSRWVAKELDIAMTQEINGKRVKVLPILLDDCELPGFLQGKAYADLRSPDRYDISLASILRRLRVPSNYRVDVQALKHLLAMRPRPVLVDTHSHLMQGANEAPDFDEIVARAKSADVHAVVFSPDRIEAKDAVTFVRSRDDMAVVLGGHPVHQITEPDHLHYERNEPLLAEDIVVGIETGLDYHFEFINRAEQESTLTRFITLARVLRKPLVIQVRESEDRVLEILRQERASDVGGIVHCFASKLDFARSVLDLGFDICFAGTLTFPKADRIREVAAWLPLDRILVESMAPFLAPVPHRGKRSEPAFIVEVVRCLAQIRGISYGTVATATTLNAVRRFGSRLEQIVCRVLETDPVQPVR